MASRDITEKITLDTYNTKERKQADNWKGEGRNQKEREKRKKNFEICTEIQKETEAEKLTDGKPKAIGGYKIGIKHSIIPLTSFRTGPRFKHCLKCPPNVRKL